MPPEHLPPTGPFFHNPPPAAPAGPEEEAPLLSEAQRRELAGLAGTLEAGRPSPQEREAAPAGDFLITPESVAEKPVTVPRPVVPDRGSDLTSLAAALTLAAPPVRPEEPAPVTEGPAAPLAAGLLPVAPVLPGILELEDAFFPARPPVRFPSGPEPEGPEAAAGEDEDFAAPPLFPVIPAPAPVPEPVADGPDRSPETDAGDCGAGPVLAGALLITAGMVLACRVPVLALEADARSVSSQALAAVKAAHLHGEMVLYAAAAAGCLVLGAGAATLRRWAPPLIHAAGWVVLITVMLSMGAATAAMFYLSANDTPGDAVPGEGPALFAMAGICGIALPLGLIAVFQRPAVARLCAAVDAHPRWTGRRSIPALMVFLTGLCLAAVSGAFGAAKILAPWFGQTAAPWLWFAAAAGFLAAAACAAAGKRAGWWLMLLISLILAASLFLTCREYHWSRFAGLPGPVEGTVAGGFFAAAALLPAILLLLMTHRSFAPREESL